MTPQQIELARHALGLPNRNSTTYRNRYFANENSSQFIEWEDLVNQGLAKICKAQKMEDGKYYLFELTKNGAIAALKKREKLCPEDFFKEG